MMSLTGCQYIMLFGYLIGGPPSIEPEFDADTGRSMTAKDATVAVVCYAPDEVKWNFDAIDRDIAKHVTFRLHQHKIQTVRPDRVQAWLDENADWDSPAEIGRALGVQYVIYIDIHKFNLYEENSSDLYRGRTDGFISVYAMDGNGDGEKIYTDNIMSIYPLIAPRDTHDTTRSRFKRAYLSRLSEEIGRHFYEYYNGDDVGAAT